MMNSTIAKKIYDMSGQFCGSKSVNNMICVRCFKAIRTKSMKALCDPITYPTIDANFNNVVYTMPTEKVEERLKELGLYHLVERNIVIVSSHFKEELDSKLLSSFGYAEVEAEIRKRAIKAVELKNIELLNDGINMEWRNGRCSMAADAVVAKLKEKGIWQLVQREISHQK